MITFRSCTLVQLMFVGWNNYIGAPDSLRNAYIMLTFSKCRKQNSFRFTFSSEASLGVLLSTGQPNVLSAVLFHSVALDCFFDKIEF